LDFGNFEWLQNPHLQKINSSWFQLVVLEFFFSRHFWSGSGLQQKILPNLFLQPISIQVPHHSKSIFFAALIFILEGILEALLDGFLESRILPFWDLKKNLGDGLALGWNPHRIFGSCGITSNNQRIRSCLVAPP